MALHLSTNLWQRRSLWAQVGRVVVWIARAEGIPQGRAPSPSETVSACLKRYVSRNVRPATVRAEAFAAKED